MLNKSALSVGLIALLALGCGQGGGDSTVEGKVTLDGFPLESGTVVFVGASAKKRSAASGSIDERGNYKLVLGSDSDLDSGEYLAQVKSLGEAIKQPDGAPPLPGKLLTPAKYARAESSGLRYRLRPGKNVIDIALASDPEPETDDAEASEGADEEPAAEESPAEEAPAEESVEAETQPAE